MMTAHDKRTLIERLEWIADWSETGIDLADAGTAREALERIKRLEYVLGCIANEDWTWATVAEMRELAAEALR